MTGKREYSIIAEVSWGKGVNFDNVDLRINGDVLEGISFPLEEVSIGALLAFELGRVEDEGSHSGVAPVRVHIGIFSVVSSN